MRHNVLMDPLGYVARGIVKTTRMTVGPMSAEDKAEVEARHAKQRALDAMRRDESVDEDGDPTF